MVTGLAGCSSVPDAINPVEWYRSGEAAILGDNEPVETGAASEPAAPAQAGPETAAAPGEAYPPPEKVPGAEKPFPNLADVPERPETRTPEQRAELASELVADNRGGQYSDEVIRLQGTIENPPPARQPVSAAVPAAAAPEPAPAPTPGPTAASTVPPAPPSAPEPAVVAPSAATPPPAIPAPPPGVGAGTTAVAAAPPPPPPPPPAVSASSPSLPPGVSASSPSLPPAVSASYPPPPPPVASPPPVDVQAVYQAKLQQRLPPRPSRPLPAPLLPEGPGETAIDGETVVVSSQGIESEGEWSIDADYGGGRSAASGRSPLPPPAGTGGITGASVATILFPDGSTRLGPRERRILQQVAALYRERGGRILLVGHASSRTASMSPSRHVEVNREISLRRAKAVARQLRRLGIPADRLVLSAVGDTQPLYREVMPSGEAGNRRVEIYFAG